ncbi:MAG: fatty acid desaturase [Caenibius sp.]
MALTQNPAAREVLGQIVKDPRYGEYTSVPLMAYQQAILVFGSLGIFALATWGYMAGHVPLWLAIPANIWAVYLAFSPLHDASHRALSSNGFLNDFLGVLTGQLLLPGVNMTAFRTIHMDHHRFVGEEGRDPDTALVDPPKWAGLSYLMFADLNWVYWYYRYGRKIWSRKMTLYIHIMLAAVIVSHVAFLMSPWWKEFLLLYVVPQRIGLGLIAYNFAHIQHPSGLTWNEHPFQSTVFIRGKSALRRLMFGQEDHTIHHLVPHVPWYKYKRIWELANGTLHEQGIPSRSWTHANRQLPELDDGKQTFLMAVAETRDEAQAIRSFLLSPVDGQALPPGHPGSHLEVTLVDNLMRQYSIVEHDRLANGWRIAVKREENGRGGSKAMHALKQGDTITVSRPHNNFVLYEAAPGFRLVAGGIGLTPLYAMANRLMRLDKPFTLHVCARSEADLAFRQTLLGHPLSSHTQVHYDTSEGASSFNPAQALAGPASRELLYICGPQGFMDWVRNEALALGWEANQIRTESFGANNTSVEDNHPFKVRLAKSNRTVDVRKDHSIIDALALAGIDTPFACMQGTCGKCATTVVDGDVDHRDAYFTDEERRQEKKACLCVSRAKGDELTLQL